MLGRGKGNPVGWTASGAGPAAALVAVVVAAKLSLLLMVLRPDGGLDALEFGFYGYVRMLVEHGRLAACLDEACSRSTRMPLMPLLYAALWTAGARSLLAIAVAKALLMGVLMLPCLAYYLSTLSDRRRVRWAAAGALFVVFLSPYYLRTSADVQAEEAILCDLLLAAGFLVMGMIRRMQAGREVRTGAAAALTALACAVFLLKSSMILVAAVLLGTAVLACGRRRASAAAAMAAVFVLAAGGWGARNLAASGRFSVGTSYEGVNLFRGWNPHTARMYPEVSLDRLMDSPTVELADGSVLPLSPEPLLGAFDDEWAWNDHYRARAVRWARENPRGGLAVTGEKLWVFFGTLRAYPISRDAVFTPRAFPGWMQRAGEAWMAIGRLAQLGIAAMLLVLWRTSPDRRWLPWIPAAILAAYAFPYIVGYAYQRHVTPWMCLLLAYALDLAWRFVRMTPRRPRSSSVSAGPVPGG